eukprot:sb/3472186/
MATFALASAVTLIHAILTPSPPLTSKAVSQEPENPGKTGIWNREWALPGLHLQPILYSGEIRLVLYFPRPFLKTEQILVDQQQPPVKTEPADNEAVKCEYNSGFIKQEVACKEDPDLLTVKTEPVDSVHINSLSHCGPVKMEPVEFSSFLDNSDTPPSSLPQIGELSSCL